MAQLLSHGGQLRAIAGRLLDAEQADCCCAGDELARLYVECCDGIPMLWVADRAFAGQPACQVIQFGFDDRGQPVCYRRTDERERIAALDSQGTPYITSFAPGQGCLAAENCIQGQLDLECRDCPEQCCIKAYPPVCRPGIDPQRCCILGSAISVRKTLSWTERRWGAFLTFGVENQYGRFVIGQWVDPIYEETWYSIETGVMVQRSRTGEYCSSYRPSGRYEFRQVRRQWVQDGYTISNLDADGQVTLASQIIPINGRYEVTDPGPFVNEDHTITDIYDAVLSVRIEVSPGVYEQNACRAVRNYRLCFGGPPCPAPGNPIFESGGSSVLGFFGCQQGQQRYLNEKQILTSPNDYPAGYVNPHSSGENIIRESRELSSSYLIDILDRTGCEITDCPDIPPPPPAPQPGGRPGPSIGGRSSGCAGCRQGPGL